MDGRDVGWVRTNALNGFEIFTNDLAKATEFYSSILDMQMAPASMDGCNVAMFPCDIENGVGGALTQMEGCEPGSGGMVIGERLDISPHGYIVIFSDPEENVVGLHSMA